MERPHPPVELVELSDLADFGLRLTPAHEVWEWLQAEILADTGSIHNEDMPTYSMQTSGSCGRRRASRSKGAQSWARPNR